MKRIVLLSCILILILNLCSCQPKVPSLPDPVFDPEPEKSAQTVYINGRKMEDLRETEEGLLYNLRDLKEAFDGYMVDGAGRESHVASLTIGESTYHYGAGQDLPANHTKALYTGEDWYVPIGDLLEGYHAFTDEEINTTYYTVYPLAEEVPAGVRIPTLMYHAVSDDCWGIPSLFVSPAELEKQLQYLKENGYTPIRFEDLGKADQYEKPFLLTFDDGYENNYTELFPIIKKYHAKITIFLIMDNIGEKNYLTEEQIREMAASGLVSFQSHTMSHPYLNTLSAEQLEYELLQSKKELAKLLGKEPFVLCYPTGKYSAATLDAVQEHYQFGLLMSGKTYETGENPLLIARKYIARDTDLESFINMIK